MRGPTPVGRRQERSATTASRTACATAILVLAAGNPEPGVATFNFGPGAAQQAASTRIRLAGTQDVVAVAKLADGSFAKASATVKVTIGGCGG